MIDTLASSPFLRSGMLLAGALFAVAALAVAAVPAHSKARASHFTLDNGMDVVVIPDHRAPVVTHMVWYRVGAADEAPGKSGIAHFLEHLMFKGTEKVASGDFSKIVARNGGQDNAFTSQDATAYFQRVAKDRLPLVMEMESDRMANLRLAEDDVLTERKVILEERRSRVDNSPSSVLNEQMLAALYQSHPYGIPIIGWEHEIKELGLDDAVDFYERFYAPNNAILVISGDVTADEVKKLAKDTYGKLKPHGDRVRAPRPKEPGRAAPVRVTLEDPRAGSAVVQRYYQAPSYPKAAPGEAEALDLLMKVATSGATSRLYKEIVVKQKIATEVGGWYSGSGYDSGRLGVYGVPAEGSTIAEVEAAIDAVLADVRENGITQKELDRARNTYIADRIYGSDSQSTLARRYGWAMVTGRSVEDVEAWPAKLEKVTLEDIKRVAQKYLDIKQSVTGILLPAKKAAQKSEKAGDKAKKS